MDRRDVDAAAWRPWIEHVCAQTAVDPALIDLPDLLQLTATVADGFTRPMAPVAAHLWGLARASDPQGTPSSQAQALAAAAIRAGA